MDGYEDGRELQRYIAELKRLLAGSELSPDTRARSLAALIEADTVTQAAERMYTAAEMTRDDTMPLLLAAGRSFEEPAQSLVYEFQGFRESAANLAAGLRRLPDR